VFRPGRRSSQYSEHRARYESPEFELAQREPGYLFPLEYPSLSSAIRPVFGSSRQLLCNTPVSNTVHSGYIQSSDNRASATRIRSPLRSNGYPEQGNDRSQISDCRRPTSTGLSSLHFLPALQHSYRIVRPERAERSARSLSMYYFRISTGDPPSLPFRHHALSMSL